MRQVLDWWTADEVHRKQVRAGLLPAVLRGLVRHWPLVEVGRQGMTGLAPYLLQYDSGRTFDAMIAPVSVNGRLFYKEDFSGFNFNCEEGRLSDALEILYAFSKVSPCPGFYIGSKQVTEYLPGLERETLVDFLPSDIPPTIWIGNAVTVATHNDNSQNIACVAVGRRRFTLFPPDQEPNLYLGPRDMTPAGRPISLVDMNAPDFSRFPLFENALAQAQVVELEPGDALYIPTNWWHHVQALEPINVLVNFWWAGYPPGLPESM